MEKIFKKYNKFIFFIRFIYIHCFKANKNLKSIDVTFLFFPFFFIFPFVPFLFPRCVSPLYYPVALPRCWGPSPRASRCRVQVLEPAAVGSKSSSHFHFFCFQYYFNVFMGFHCIFDHYVQYHSTQSSLNSHSD